jgi:thioredoxin-like negative regulator of GroEL
MITNDINQTFKSVDLNDKTLPQNLDKIEDDKDILLDNIVNLPEKLDQIPNDKKNKYNLSFPSLIYFSKSDCKFCDSFNPIWDEIKVSMSDMNLNFIKMDCQKNAKKCKDFKIDEVPTIKLFIGRKGIKFSGTRTLENIKEFLNKNIL